MTAPSTSSPHTDSYRPPRLAHVLLVFGLAVLARAVVFYFRRGEMLALAAAGAANPLTAFGGSDIPGWLGMAEHLYYNRSLTYWLMGARPPLFPLTVALTWAAGGSSVDAVALQALFGALTAVLGYLLAHRLFALSPGFPQGDRWALIGGIIMALDPASVSVSVTLLGEPVFNLAFTACILFLAAYVGSRRALPLILSALSLAAAMLARPTAIYFWLAAPLILVPLVRRWWRPALALAAVGLLVYVGWSARNLRYHDVFTYSLQDNFSLLFLRALSAEHLATGRPTDELYAEYMREVYLAAGDEEAATSVDPKYFWDFQVAESPALYHAMRPIAVRRLLRYWPTALAGTFVGAARMGAYSELLPRWFRPFEIVYHLALYGMALAGVWIALRRKDWAVLLITAVPIVYITGLTLVSLVSGIDTRMRTPITAMIGTLAIYGLARLRISSRSDSSQESTAPI